MHTEFHLVDPRSGVDASRGEISLTRISDFKKRVSVLREKFESHDFRSIAIQISNNIASPPSLPHTIKVLLIVREYKIRDAEFGDKRLFYDKNIYLYIINNIITSSRIVVVVIFRKQFLIVVRSLKTPYCRLKLKTNVLEVTIVNYIKLHKIIQNYTKLYKN